MSGDIKRIDIKEFRELGLLAEINRSFLHPIGLALEVKIEEDGTEKLDGIWDYRDDPEGMLFYEDHFPLEQVKRAKEFIKQKHEQRMESLGFIYQDIDNTENNWDSTGIERMDNQSSWVMELLVNHDADSIIKALTEYSDGGGDFGYDNLAINKKDNGFVFSFGFSFEYYKNILEVDSIMAKLKKEFCEVMNLPENEIRTLAKFIVLDWTKYFM